jgi:hypothetical protein
MGKHRFSNGIIVSCLVFFSVFLGCHVSFAGDTVSGEGEGEAITPPAVGALDFCATLGDVARRR